MIMMTSHYQNFKTTQNNLHPSLTEVVQKHEKTIFLRPIPHHQRIAFEKIKRFINDRDLSLIIDSGCGTGLSTIKLAQMFPHHVVIGIDKSIARLKRAQTSQLTNFLLIQGNVIDIWRLLALEQWSISHHFLLHPNPYPKACQLKKRFYAHPVFKTMVSLATHLEVRTNWYTYAHECARALTLLGQHPQVSNKSDEHYMTLFEKKYIAAKCPIYVVTNELKK